MEELENDHHTGKQSKKAGRRGQDVKITCYSIAKKHFSTLALILPCDSALVVSLLFKTIKIRNNQQKFWPVQYPMGSPWPHHLFNGT